MKQDRTKSSNPSRSKTLSFRANEAEFNAISSIIKRSGLSRQEYLLTGALGKTIYEIVELKPIHHELKAIVTNLNQLTFLAQQGRINVIDLVEVTSALEKTYAAINGLYKNLSGTIASGNTEENKNGDM